MPATPPTGPLNGIKVVDLTTTFMGPYATMLLARMGADVVKVEEPAGDVTRGLADTGAGAGPAFLNANHGKRSIAIDLKSSVGRAALLRLIERADVFVTNVRPQALARLGLTPETIHETNPRAIVATLVGFAPGGPYSGRAAYDDAIQAISGIADVQGGDGEPAYVKSVIADKTVGLMAVNGILAALVARGVTGRGTVVTVPMFESMAAFNMLELQGGYVFETPRGPSGYARVSSPFRKPYRTADGYLGVVVYTDRMWLAFFELIGRPELADEPRYATIAARTAHVDEMYELIDTELAKESSAYWLEKLSAAGIPALPVQSIADLRTDEHLRAVALFEDVDHPTAGPLRLPGLATQFSDTPCSRETRPAPLLGQHGPEVLAEAGMTAAEIDELRAAGILVVTDDPR